MHQPVLLLKRAKPGWSGTPRRGRAREGLEQRRIGDVYRRCGIQGPAYALFAAFDLQRSGHHARYRFDLGPPRRLGVVAPRPGCGRKHACTVGPAVWKSLLPGFLHGEGDDRGQPYRQAFERQGHHRPAGSPPERVRLVAIKGVAPDIEEQGRQVVGAELGNAPHRVRKHIAAVGGANLSIKLPETMQDVALKRRHVRRRDRLGLVESGKRAQQVAERIAQLSIGVGRGLQDRLADPLVLGIVGQRRPEAEDLGAALIGNLLGLDAVAQGLRHLLSLFVEGEAVRHDRPIGRPAARAAGLQQGGLKPAAVLVRTLRIEVCRPVAVGAALKREGVGGSGIEPDIEDVLDLLIGLRIEVAEKVLGRTREPGVGAFQGDQSDDPVVHRRILAAARRSLCRRTWPGAIPRRVAD